MHINNKVLAHSKWKAKYSRPSTKLKCIKGRYYLYECSSVYEKVKKRGVRRRAETTREERRIQEFILRNFEGFHRLNRHLKNTFIVMLNPLRFYMVRRFREVESDEVSFGFSSCVEVVSQLVPST